MKISPFPLALLTGALLASPAFGQTSDSSPAGNPASSTATSGMPNEAEMMKQMMDLAKLNENHKLLGELAGDWTYSVKMWMAPGAPPTESKGTGTRKPIMGGRYYMANYDGTVKMPDEHGKLKDMPFHGSSIEGYDNVKRKFVSTWIDNMGTGILMSEGDYDPSTKTFTYNFEMEMMPGMKTAGREVIKVIDKDHHTFEWYENQGGQNVKTMEINYTRKK